MEGFWVKPASDPWCLYLVVLYFYFYIYSHNFSNIGYLFCLWPNFTYFLVLLPLDHGIRVFLSFAIMHIAEKKIMQYLVYHSINIYNKYKDKIWKKKKVYCWYSEWTNLKHEKKNLEITLPLFTSSCQFDKIGTF